jgi:hypothetical protein
VLADILLSGLSGGHRPGQQNMMGELRETSATMKAVAASKQVRLASASPCSSEAPRSSSARYPQVFCPTPVSEAQERVRALTKVCQAFQPAVDGWRSPSLFTRGLNESIGEGGRGVSQYVPANAP